jgi:hypothetical protein
MTRLALRWIATHLLAKSAAIRSSACGAQLGQSRPLGSVNCEESIYPPTAVSTLHRL